MRASGPVTGNFVPFEGYRLGAGEPTGTEPALGGRPSDADASLPGEATDEEEPPTTAFTIDAGAVIAATGFDHYVPRKGEYGYERIPQVVTLPDFIRWLSEVEPGSDAARLRRQPRSPGGVHPLRR